jgi:hypothetical protein
MRRATRLTRLSLMLTAQCFSTTLSISSQEVKSYTPRGRTRSIDFCMHCKSRQNSVREKAGDRECAVVPRIPGSQM